jgi:small conductance mechanosensitive channel
VANKSQDWSRAVLDIQVSHDTEVARAEEVIKQAADEVWRDERWQEAIIAEPEVWGVEGFGSSGITIRLVVKTRPSDQFRVQRALRQGISDAFRAAGIRVPVVQTVTHSTRTDEDEG